MEPMTARRLVFSDGVSDWRKFFIVQTIYQVLARTSVDETLTIFEIS